MCIIVPATEAIITTVVSRVITKKEKKTRKHSPAGSRLHWLNKMLWGGSGLLAFEHIWHGEVVPFFPFLTAAETPESTAVMLHEMATNGVAMAVLVTAVWGCMVVGAELMERRTGGETV